MLLIYTIASSSMPTNLLEAHQYAAKVCALPMRYVQPSAPADSPSLFVGKTMNSIASELLKKNLPGETIVCFLDLDAFPLNIPHFWSLIRMVSQTSVTIGCSACSNHIAPYNEEFISPWFSIWKLKTIKEAFSKNVSFVPSSVGDVCQDISRYLFVNKTPPILLSPLRYLKTFDDSNKGRLAGSRRYGYSTLYESEIFHGFQSRVHSPSHFIKTIKKAESCNFNISESDMVELKKSKSALDSLFESTSSLQWA